MSPSPFHRFLATLLLATATVLGAEPALKPRIVVLTDISPNTVEPDDTESMVRLLVHADEFEIEGLVATTGWSNGGGNEHPELLHGLVDAYAKDLPNLLRRSGQQGHRADETRQPLGYWPSPGYLRSRTMLGSRTRGLRFLGRDNVSPGSDLILRLADEADARPVWILAWGGANTLAQAVWQAQRDRSPEAFRAFLRRLRLYTITDQDRGYEKGTPFDISAHQWLRREFPRDLFHLWDESAWTYQNGTGKARWEEYAAEIQGHGHLGALYPKYRYGVEGDTPSFLYVQANGLNDPESPSAVGWGGFFRWGKGPDGVTEAYVNGPGTPTHAVSRKYEARFYPAVFNAFSARMKWARDGKGNREPEVIVDGAAGREPIRRQPVEGTALTLDASATRDPDGDALRFSWWIAEEAGDGPKEVRLAGETSERATVTLPPGSAGKRLQVVCEVTDAGTPPLTAYRRIVLEPTAARRTP
jgi:hypothetical protein